MGFDCSNRATNPAAGTCTADADPATTHFAERYRDWEHLVGGLDLAVVPGGEHYFVRDRAGAVAARIDQDHPAEEASA